MASFNKRVLQTHSNMKPVQQRVPGLIGMAVNTDCVYLKSLQDHAGTITNSPMSSLRVHLHTIDFSQFVTQLNAGAVDKAEAMLVEGAEGLHRSGADFLVLTANTGAAILASTGRSLALPMLDITDAAFAAAPAAKRLGLLSTMATAQLGLYQRAGASRGIEVILPPPPLAAAVQQLIYGDLIAGRFHQAGADILLSAVAWFERNQADGVLLGCTDLTHLLPLIGSPQLPLLDTTRLHAEAAARVALGIDKL